MSDDQFMKLFKYVEEMRTDMDGRFDQIASKQDVSEIYDKLDQIAARLDDDDTERVALQAEVDRHGDWIDQLAHQTGAKLSPEL